VRVAGRATQGVKLVNLDGNDIVTAVARVIPEDDKEVEGGNGDEPLPPDAPELALESGE
jgi:DNA gyrase subunit A